MTKRREIIYIDATPILAERLSGIGHLVLQMIRGLETYSTELDVRLLVPINKTHLVNKWELKKITLVKIPLPARIWNYLPRLRLSLPIDFFLKKGVYIFPNFKAWPLIRSKSITYIHDISFALFPEFTEERNLRALKDGVPRWMDRSDLVITDSYSSKYELIEYHPGLDLKVKVIHCGVDTRIFYKRTNQEIDNIKKKYNIEGAYAMFLSSLEPRKNIERILGSLMLLPEDMQTSFSLVLIGGMGWRNEAIHAKIEQLRNAGWNIIKPEVYVPDEDIPALLSGATALLHPALHEGFGIPAIEAMACQAPVITSNIPVMREVCESAAVYVDPYSEQGIASATANVFNDFKLQDKLRKLGLERVRQFTWEKSVDELVDTIRSVSTRYNK